VGFDRFRRDDKYDRVGLRNQATEARLPVLASHDVVPVEKWREATIFETSYQFVGKLGRILARIGDEDLELFARARISHRLLDHIAGGCRARAARSARLPPWRPRWLVPARESKADPPLNSGGQRRSSGPCRAGPNRSPPRGVHPRDVADEHVVGIVRHEGPVPTNPVVASLLAETRPS